NCALVQHLIRHRVRQRSVPPCSASPADDASDLERKTAGTNARSPRWKPGETIKRVPWSMLGVASPLRQPRKENCRNKRAEPPMETGGDDQTPSVVHARRDDATMTA